METDRETAIRENLGLVVSRVKRWNGGAYDDDMFQVGCEGLIKAVDKFDPGRGCKFATYAVPTIDGHILVYIQRTNHTIRPLRKSMPGHDAYYYREVNSIDATKFYNDEKLFVSDIIADIVNVEVDAISGQIVDYMLSQLNETERRIIELRMEEYCQQEIAEIMNMSQAHVSRIIKKCKKLLSKQGYEREATAIYKKNYFRATRQERNEHDC